MKLQSSLTVLCSQTLMPFVAFASRVRLVGGAPLVHAIATSRFLSHQHRASLSGARTREISSGGLELHFDPELKKRDGNSPPLRDCVLTFSVGGDRFVAFFPRTSLILGVLAMRVISRVVY